MKPIIIICILLIPVRHAAQGCATVKNVAIVNQNQFVQSDLGSTSSSWVIGIDNRYFKSFRDFRGKIDLETPPENQTINKNFTTELSVNHLMRNGWSLTLTVPIVNNVREASREHGGPNTERFKTRAYGLGDLRLVLSKWMLQPNSVRKGNFQLGLGLKFPTGDFAQKDYFHRSEGLVLAPVNPGIQPGDGGLGIIAEASAYYNLTQSTGLYANIYYMANPREHNGASWGAFSFTEEQIEAGIDLMSVPDVFALRGGLYHNVASNFTISAGLRFEGVPVEDLIGGSRGGRRPGHYFSIEPGFILRRSKISFYGYAPVIVSREIKQTIGGRILGVHGPGGSADQQFFFGVLFKL